LPQDRCDAPLSLSGQHLPDGRRQVAHGGIQANALGRTALGCRSSVIHRIPSIYKRYSQWDIENFFGKLKEFKRIAMRSDKTDQSFAAMIDLAAAIINSR
jgi:transposase